MQTKRALMMKIKMGVAFWLSLAVAVPAVGQAPRTAGRKPDARPRQRGADGPADSDGEGTWSYYGKDAGGGRYTPLQQINGSNIGRLAPAWTYRTGELKTYAGTSAMEKAAFETTPVLVGRTLYFSTPSDRVIAVDGATGRERWVFDPKVDLRRDYSEISSRGVAVWPQPDGRQGQRGATGPAGLALRIFIGTIDGRLIALNAATGQPETGFGRMGTVDLKEGLGSSISETSPPTVIGDLVIVGSSLGDNQRFNYPPGVVRAYDVRTGGLRWSWNPIPTDASDTAFGTWQGPKAHQTGGANAWSILSTDPGRDLVFIPTTSPSPDYYGGERKGSNQYGNSIVALRASTGKMVWSFQVVHHDLWDFDIAAQPMLVEIERGGTGMRNQDGGAGAVKRGVAPKARRIAAVVVGTKMGHIFVLDRETGASLFPIEERSVPQSNVVGEASWPTQPFPVLPAPLGLQHVSVRDAWGPTPEDKKEAEQRIAQYRYEGPFTPPSAEGTIMAPGNVGGIHWGGMCYDPVSGWLITNINRIAAVIHMLPREQVDRLEKEQPAMMRAETGRQEGTPYIMKRDYLFKANQRGMLMQTQPPWGTLVAIDLHTGQKKWEVPLGYMLDPKKFPGAENWGSLNFGGAIVTGGGLVFVAASMDGHFRAFDRRTGKVMWEFELPAGGQATPMSYSIDGRQYVVIAAGGHGKLKTRMGDYLMAFALAEKKGK
jgi:quinoprotein glucose dehydrogenase